MLTDIQILAYFEKRGFHISDIRRAPITVYTDKPVEAEALYNTTDESKSTPIIFHSRKRGTKGWASTMLFSLKSKMKVLR